MQKSTICKSRVLWMVILVLLIVLFVSTRDIGKYGEMIWPRLISSGYRNETTIKEWDAITKHIRIQPYTQGGNTTKPKTKEWDAIIKHIRIQPYTRGRNTTKPITKGSCPSSKTISKVPPEKEITIVTAYYNLGSFKKGNGDNVYTPDRYKNWMSVFEYIQNPLVVYVDQEDTANVFKELRRGKEDKTKIFVLDKNKMWSFGLRERIQKVYSMPGYPKHHPNTVIPGYSCAQHAKFECLEQTIHTNYFSTNYFSWLDIGDYRAIVNCNRDFKIVLPDEFDESKVSYTRVFSVNMAVPIKQIIYQNSVWVGGAMSLAKKEPYLKFIQLYKDTVKMLLGRSLMNTDQQIIYCLYSDEGRKLLKPTVELQLYPSSDWFHLSYVCHRFVDSGA